MGAPEDPAIGARLAAIAEHYAIGTISSYTRLGGTNQNFRVRTDTGDYVCKIITNMEFDDILHGLPFLTRLEQHRFPAAVHYLRSPAGEVAYRSPGCSAVLLRYVAGAEPEPSTEMNHLVGTRLAQLHRIDHDGLPDKAHWLDDVYLPTTLAQAVTLYGENRLARTLAVVDELRGFRPSSLPQAIIHGDLGTDNSLIASDGSITFLDWQDVGIGAAVVDFAQTVLGFCFRDRPAGPWRADFDADLYLALYEGYASVRPFTGVEIAGLDAALRWVGITQPVWSILVWDQYHPGREMLETDTLYWAFGLDELSLPRL